MNKRLKWLKNQLKALNLEGMIVSNPINIKYLTGLNAEGVLIIAPRETVFITDSRYIEDVNSKLTISDEIVAYDSKNLSKYDYEGYWAHYAAYSDGKGGECWRVGVKGGLGHKCGRIRGDDEREKFADLVLSDDFYDVSKKNRDYRNVIVAELIYPYIGTIKKEKD